MTTTGVHYILDLYECQNVTLLDDAKDLTYMLEESATIAKMNILTTQVHKFKPQGVSVIVMVSESHISIHTFPEHNFASCDIYTCSENDPIDAVKYIIKNLNVKNPKILKVNRGETPLTYKEM